MNKAAPSFARIAAMVVFALSCFGLLLFLWLAFGGPIPLKPQGYRFTTSFAEATQLATEADVRISGVPVGKVKTIEPDKRTGRSTVDDRARVALRAAARRTPAPSCARRRCWGRPTSSSRRGPRTPSRSPTAARWPRRRSRPRCSSTRSTARSTPTRGERSRRGCRSRPRRIGDYGRDVNDALGNLGPFAEDTATLVDILNRQEGAVTGLVSNTGVVFEALTERGDQLRSLIENSNRVFATTADARRAAQGGVRRAPDLRARVDGHARPPVRVRARHRPAGHPAAARRRAS